MLSLTEAKTKMEDYLRTLKVHPPVQLMVMDQYTIEFKYGWAFIYQSKEYIESGDISTALGGNGAVIINKFDGKIHQTGSAHPPEKYITEYIDCIEKNSSFP